MLGRRPELAQLPQSKPAGRIELSPSQVLASFYQLGNLNKFLPARRVEIMFLPARRVEILFLPASREVHEEQLFCGTAPFCPPELSVEKTGRKVLGT